MRFLQLSCIVATSFIGLTSVGCEDFQKGFGKATSPPPLTIKTRPSLLGNSNVIILQNHSTANLTNVTLKVKDENREILDTVLLAEQLKPGDTCEIGVLQLGPILMDERLRFFDVYVEGKDVPLSVSPNLIVQEKK